MDVSEKQEFEAAIRAAVEAHMAQFTRSGGADMQQIMLMEEFAAQVQAEPQHPYGSSSAAAVEEVHGAGCWCIVETEGAEGATERYFGNRYYKAGERIYSYSGTSPELAIYNSKTVALKINATTPESATVQAYETFAAMQADALDPAYVVKPLYTFDDEGAIVTDWRNIPQAQMVEVLR